MALKSELLSPNRRLQQASAGPPSIKPFPSVEDRDAVKRIQEALIKLGYLPADFGQNLLSGEILGVFGKATESAVKAFQKDEFPNSPGDWDGKVGKGTITKLDARLTGAGPQPGGDSIEQIMDAEAAEYPHVVVDPNTVSSDPRRQGDLRSVTVKKPFILLVFKIKRGGQLYWIQAAAPSGLRRFDAAHVFFHPNPGFAGLHDRDYAETKGNWNTVYRYGPWMGSQSVAAGRDQVMIVPIMSNAHYANLGFFADNPIARINELLFEVQKWVNPYDPNEPQLAALGASSFSFGINPLAMFIGKVAGSRLLREVFDFDGLFSNSAHRTMAAVAGAEFKKYAQNTITGVVAGRAFVLPLPRWRTYIPTPQTEREVHALMPGLLYHALST